MSDILKPGDIFLEYRLLEVLGEGGMGIVFKAEELESEDIVAIKCLQPRHANREDFAARFKQECRIYPKLKHPHIVRMRRAGVSPAPQKTAFIVMDLLEGKTLRRMLNKYFRLDYMNALLIMIQIAEPLRFAHSKGIVHRDLKPENIMVDALGDEMGHVWLMDFGIAKTTTGGMNTDDVPEVGTARYMSPEQVRNILGAARKGQRMKLDGRIDIYAFGIIFYELLTGRHIFIDDDDPPTFEETLTGHLLADPKPVHEVVPECVDSVWHVIKKCLAIDRDERYLTFDEVAADLRQLVRESVPPEHPLARRLLAENAKLARKTAYAALPKDELEIVDDPSRREALVPEAPGATERLVPRSFAPVSGRGEAHDDASWTAGRAAFAATLPVEPASHSEVVDVGDSPEREARGTMPLVNFVPTTRALPFLPPATSPFLAPVASREPEPRGKGHTDKLPTSGSFAFRPPAAPPAKPPPSPSSWIEGPTSSTSAVVAQPREVAPSLPTPAVMTAPPRPLPPRFVLAPIVGLALTLMGSVLVHIVQTRHPDAASPSPAAESSPSTGMDSRTAAPSAGVPIDPAPALVASASATSTASSGAGALPSSGPSVATAPRASAEAPRPVATTPKREKPPVPASRPPPSRTPTIPLVTDEPAPKLKKGLF